MAIVSKDDMEALEGMVDKYTLFEVLVALDVIAGDKADHLRANWQDHVSAKTWDRARAAVTKAANGLAWMGV